ncbi:MAG: beta-propeller repeat protein, partial [Gammaproteobacteria bacterium]|nr:beta-propeller repeat protein [Gammaproteobacteria bacterium]
MKLPSRNHLIAGLFALAMTAAGLAVADVDPTRTAENATRTVGPQINGSIVASDNQLLTPAGTLVQLGSPVRAKAVAVNPNHQTRTAAVLLMGAGEPIIVFNTSTGEVVQRYIPSTGSFSNDSTGSFTGITYSADGAKLLFSQDDNFVAVANVDPFSGELTPAFRVSLPSPAANPLLYNSFSANPGGIAVADASIGLVALNANNTLGVISLDNGTLTSQIPVGNAPNSVVVKGKFAYVSNEGGRPATASDFTNLSDGTPIVVDRTNASAITGTVSVVDIEAGRLVKSINVGLHPVGMAMYGKMLYVANSYEDTLSVIDTELQKVVRTISIGVPIAGGAFGAGANGIVIADGVGYVTLGQSNAIAVVDIDAGTAHPDGGKRDREAGEREPGTPDAVMGYIPTGYFPTTIAFDAARRVLIVSDDKGLGAQGSIGTSHGVSAFNTHQDAGVVNLIPLPSTSELAKMTKQVFSNNHWNSQHTHVGAHYVDRNATPVAIPAHIGEPSLIKHVFLIIKENRTYDQMLGDLPQANGDPSLAVFAANVPNQHALVKRFPLLDNMYAPSRQSADGHPWIVESGSFYSNDVLSPDWIRSYPGGNSNDALTYTPKGFIWSEAVAKGLNVKMYGEWSGGYTIAPKPGGGSYSWADFYNTALYKESGGTEGANVVPDNSDTESTAVPSASAVLDPHYPSFNLGIPDQYRADYYLPIFRNQDATGTVPALTIMWLPDDHTNGTTTGNPLPANYQADNDLALGRIVEAISHSSVWGTSAIFIEEDDSQDGVDHVDGHRQPVYIVSPYTVPAQSPGVGQVIHTTYTAENINRTIESILGLAPLTQFDLTVSPMFDCFQNSPNFAPFIHVAATTPLNIGPGNVPIPGTGPANFAKKMTPVQKAWNLASNAMTKGKEGKADSVDENFLNHVIWYSATDWKRPYPGDTKILWPAS